MNWIDKIFGKKEESSAEVEFDKFPGWLESKSRRVYWEIGRHASSFYPEIEEVLEKLKESTTLLEEAEPEGRFHISLVKIAKSNRGNTVKQVRILLKDIIIPKATDIGTIVTFHEGAVQNLSICLENMMKSYQYTKLVFFEESKQLIADVNELGKLLNQLIEPVNNQKNVLEAFENATNTLKDIEGTISDIEIQEKTIKKHGEKIVLLKKEIDEKQKAIVLLRDSQAWKEYMNYMDDLILLENNAGKIKSEINTLISPLSKALSRLKQLSDSERYILEPKDREDLKLCLSDPVNVNPGFVIEFQKIVESGILNLSPEKKDKILEQVKLVTASLDSYKGEYQNLLLDIEKKKNEIAGINIDHEEISLTEKIAALQEKLTTSEKELETEKKHLVFLRRNTELKKQELRQIVSVIDPFLSIVLDNPV